MCRRHQSGKRVYPKRLGRELRFRCSSVRPESGERLNDEVKRQQFTLRSYLVIPEEVLAAAKHHEVPSVCNKLGTVIVIKSPDSGICGNDEG